MPIYIAKKIQESSFGHAQFQIRNIRGYTQAKPSEVHVTGVPNKYEAAYGAYRTHIDLFIGANLVQKALPLTTSGVNVSFGDSDIRPVGPFSFQSGVALSSDSEERLISRIPGISKEKIGKVTKFTVKSGNFDAVMKILQFASPTFSPGAGVMSVQAAHLAHILLFCIRGFLATNQYPAFSSIRGTTLAEEFAGTIIAAHTECGGTATDSYGWTEEDSSRSLVKRRRTEVEAKMEEARTDEEKQLLETESIRAVKISSLRDAVWRAPVKKGDPKRNYGPVGSVPQLPGIVFPYFHGMNAPDQLSLKMGLNIFLRLLGKDGTAAKAKFTELRQYCSSLAGSSLGMEIAHMLAGVRIALETQGRLYLVVEGEYKGFVLLGAEYSVFDGTKWMEEQPAKELRSDLNKMDTHSASLGAVCEFLSALKIEGSDDIEEITVESVASAQALIQEIRKRDLSGDQVGEMLDEINAKMRALYFGGGYTDINADSIHRFMEDLLDEDKPDIPIDGPLFLPSIKMDFGDRLLMHLARFGPEAPVPHSNSGIEYPVPPPSQKDDPIFEPKEGSPLSALPFYAKPIQVAANDWRAIQKKKVVMLNLKERAGPYRSFMFKSIAEKRRLWMGVRAVVHSKRAREQDMAASQEKVAKKLKVNTEAGVLSLFI
jgi:hypothetical protein